MRSVFAVGIASFILPVLAVCGGQSISKPLLLEKSEGELRTRRPRPKPIASTQFMLKVDPLNNGSQHLVAGTEDIAPGASIPTHKHPTETKFCSFIPARRMCCLAINSVICMPADSFSSPQTLGSA